jgi:hypothetical protein
MKENQWRMIRWPYVRTVPVWKRQLSQDVTADEGFLCYKAPVLRNKIKGTLFILHENKNNQHAALWSEHENIGGRYKEKKT